MVQKKTKILCTIGPASQDEETLSQMIAAGMDAARLNFSHGTHEEKHAQIVRLRRLAEKENQPITIIADLQGPKLRLGSIQGEQTISKGQLCVLSSQAEGNEIPLQLDLSMSVKEGQRMFLNDGLVELVVQKVEGKKITATAQNNGWIASNKGINIPDTFYNEGPMTEKDLQDATFALSEHVDYVALSFVQRAEDVAQLRSLVDRIYSKAKIIVKIEKKEAVHNLEAIMKEADAVMIARGDLAIETSASEVPVLQQKIIRLGRQLQKPVIVATQMLESMIQNPRPTRAEASDVAHAVLSQVDAVMLSAESAAGKYPVEAVKVMNDIINSVEENPDFHHAISLEWSGFNEESLRFNAITSVAALLAKRINVPLLAVATSSGRTARLITSFRPDAAIVAITHDRETQQQLNLLWGVTPIVVPPAESGDLYWEKIAAALRMNNLVQSGDRVVMVAGSLVGVSGATDTIKVYTLSS